MTGDAKLHERLSEVAKENAARQANELKANSAPLPGALRDAFAIAKDIQVGPYTVRPFYDADFEFLQILDHPMLQAMVAAQTGEKFDTAKVKRSAVWEVIYMMTNPIDDIDDLFAKGDEGVKELRQHARKAFGRMQGQGITALDEAVGVQLQRYWDPCIGYTEATEEATSNSNFCPATEVKPVMASVG